MGFRKSGEMKLFRRVFKGKPRDRYKMVPPGNLGKFLSERREQEEILTYQNELRIWSYPIEKPFPDTHELSIILAIWDNAQYSSNRNWYLYPSPYEEKGLIHQNLPNMAA